MTSTANFKPSGVSKRSPVWRRVIVFLIGGVLLGIGIAMLILPGPAIIFIPLGLAILATEFRWAKRSLTTTRQWIRHHLKKSPETKQ